MSITAGRVPGTQSWRRAAALLAVTGISLAVASGTAAAAPNGDIGARPAVAAAGYFPAAVLADPLSMAADNFGTKLALSTDGSTAVVGAPGTKGGQGAVYVFSGNGGAFHQVFSAAGTAPGGGTQIYGLGASVAVDATGSVVIAGAPRSTTPCNTGGLADIYSRQGTTYTKTATLLPAVTGCPSSQFGATVSLNAAGTEAVVVQLSPYGPPPAGSNQPTPLRGRIYIFDHAGKSWKQAAVFDGGAGSGAGDGFGSALAVNAPGSLLVATATGSGSLFVFKQIWVKVKIHHRKTKVQRFVPTTIQDPNSDGDFGTSVAMSASGSTILVGAAAPSYASNPLPGEAFLFHASGKTYKQVAKFTASDGVGGDQFGASVALSSDGSTGAVGAPARLLNRQKDVGALYLFHFSPAGSPTENGALLPTNDAYNAAGSAVAMSGTGGMLLTNTVSPGPSSLPGVTAYSPLGSQVSTTQLALTHGADPSTYGSPVTVTATITGGQTAQGMITFWLTSSGSVVADLGTLPLSGGAASLPTASLPVEPGPEGVTAQYYGDANHQASAGSLAETISPAPLTIQPLDQPTVWYGSYVGGSLAYNGYGFVNGDAEGSLTVQPNCTSPMQAYNHKFQGVDDGWNNAPVGQYSITCTGASDPNYAISYQPGTLTVNPAPLTFTAETSTKHYGDRLGVGYTLSGLRNYDTPADVITTGPSCSAPIATNSKGEIIGDPGPYTSSCSGAVVNSNYTPVYVSGIITVDPAVPTLQYLGATTATNGQSFTPSFQLFGVDGVVLANRQVEVLMAYQQPSQQTCYGTTDGNGVMSCTIQSVSQTDGNVYTEGYYAGDTTTPALYGSGNAVATITVS